MIHYSFLFKVCRYLDKRFKIKFPKYIHRNELGADFFLWGIVLGGGRTVLCGYIKVNDPMA